MIPNWWCISAHQRKSCVSAAAACAALLVLHVSLQWWNDSPFVVGFEKGDLGGMQHAGWRREMAHDSSNQRYSYRNQKESIEATSESPTTKMASTKVLAFEMNSDLWTRKLHSRRRFAERLERLKDYCSHGYKNWYYSSDHRLLIAMNLKAASSTLHAYLRELLTEQQVEQYKEANGMNWRMKMHTTHYQLPFSNLTDLGWISGRERDRQSAPYTFTVVRHPFKHVVSSYHNKVIDDVVSKNLIKRIREYNDIKDKSISITPLHIMLFLVKSPSRYWLGGHFLPFSQTNDFCWAEFDAIAHLETFDDDFRAIMADSGLARLLNTTIQLNKSSYSDNKEPQRKENKMEYHNPYLPSKQDQDFYSQVPESLMREVYKLYETDFDIFGYDPETYFALAKRG